MLLRIAAGVAALAIGVSAVSAQNATAIQARKDLMKSNAAASRVFGAMLKGEERFDLGKVQAALRTLEGNAAVLASLFPDDSRVGDTRALPNAWTNRPALNAAIAKLGTDAKSAGTEIKDEAGFKAGISKVTSNCGSCHKQFQAPAR